MLVRVWPLLVLTVDAVLARPMQHSGPFFPPLTRPIPYATPPSEQPLFCHGQSCLLLPPHPPPPDDISEADEFEQLARLLLDPGYALSPQSNGFPNQYLGLYPHDHHETHDPPVMGAKRQKLVHDRSVSTHPVKAKEIPEILPPVDAKMSIEHGKHAWNEVMDSDPESDSLGVDSESSLRSDRTPSVQPAAPSKRTLILWTKKEIKELRSLIVRKKCKPSSRDLTDFAAKHGRTFPSVDQKMMTVRLEVCYHAAGNQHLWVLMEDVDESISSERKVSESNISQKELQIKKFTKPATWTDVEMREYQKILIVNDGQILAPDVESLSAQFDISNDQVQYRLKKLRKNLFTFYPDQGWALNPGVDLVTEDAREQSIAPYRNFLTKYNGKINEPEATILAQHLRITVPQALHRLKHLRHHLYRRIGSGMRWEARPGARLADFVHVGIFQTPTSTVFEKDDSGVGSLQGERIEATLSKGWTAHQITQMRELLITRDCTIKREDVRPLAAAFGREVSAVISQVYRFKLKLCKRQGDVWSILPDALLPEESRLLQK